MSFFPLNNIASELVLLQNDIGNKLLSESYFSNIPVFVVRSRTIDAAVTAAIMGTSFKQNQTGLAVQVLMPTASCVEEYEKVPGPFFLISYCVRIQEYPLINMGATGTQKTSEEVALNVLNLLHLFKFGRSLDRFRASPNALTPSLDFEPRLTYDCEFHAVYQLPDANASRVPTPVAEISGTTLTLTCADPAASIYYSLQDTDYPAAGLGGTLYGGPLTVTVGQSYRVAAYNVAGGFQGSEIIFFDVTA